MQTAQKNAEVRDKRQTQGLLESFFLGEGLEKVDLVAFRLDKVRKVPKNAETAKDTKGTVFAPRFLHASLVGGFGARPSKKNGRKSGYKRYTATRKWPPGLQKAQTFLGPEISRYT